MDQCNSAVAQRFRVERLSDDSEGLEPQIRGRKVDHILERPALRLEMVRPKVHSFKPHHFGEMFHSVSRLASTPGKYSATVHTKAFQRKEVKKLNPRSVRKMRGLFGVEFGWKMRRLHCLRQQNH